MKFFLAFIAISSVLICHATAQCSATDNAQCTNWVKNGFCQNSYYSSEQKKKFCGNACGLCSTGGSACVDANINCAKWSAAGKCSVAAVKSIYCCLSCNCVNWVKNGFCNNMGYSLAQRQASCGISCGLCTSAGVPIVPGVCTADANANCANWAANGFCNNAAYTQATKTAYCCKTCASATTTTGGTTVSTTTATTTTTTTVAPGCARQIPSLRIMNTVLISALLLCFGSEIAAQCTTSDNAYCASWVPNGFCNNSGYSLAQRQAYCGISCGLCTSAGVPIIPGSCTADANANCAVWASNGFCTNPAYTAATIQAYCCKTCGATTTTSTSTTSTTTTTTAAPGGG
ncbi:hypothetical protein PRIPAC_79757 [Pristionchus pacificus]|uniref:ShK domain-containing protein n=1 Tax=Pristionchus pacificus TaxID=54126 RepID=A0A2A6C330_PRIPA|nr:hypothetical protein PRIPAC_79757 [Pristionchus pacificus]|eukprot:PDM72585.1 ShK domain-containing protein [Pristionchus pacificus]